jgi:hypothetical protein
MACLKCNTLCLESFAISWSFLPSKDACQDSSTRECRDYTHLRIGRTSISTAGHGSVSNTQFLDVSCRQHHCFQLLSREEVGQLGPEIAVQEGLRDSKADNATELSHLCDGT